MLIQSLTVSGAGHFSTPHHLVGLGQGLNVLSAANGTGKSTMFEALWLALFGPYKTAAESFIGTLPTYGASLPLSVHVKFEIDEVVWRLEKQFLQRAYSRLFQGEKLVADGTESDEKLWSLLGIRAKERRHFDVLWAKQEGATQELIIPESAMPTLQAAVQQQLGAVIDGGPARALLADVNADLDKVLTSTKSAKKNGPLATLIAQVQSLETTLNDLTNRQNTAQSQRDELAKVRDDLDQFARDGVATRLTQSAQETADALAQAKGRQAEHDALVRAVATAQTGLARVQDDQTNAQAALRRLKDATEAQVDLEGVAAEKQALWQAVLKRAPVEIDTETLIAAQGAIKIELAMVNLRTRHQTTAATLPSLEADAKKAQSINDLLLKSRAALDALPAITDTSLKDIEAAELLLLEAKAAARAGRATVTMSRLGAGDVSVGGAPLGQSRHPVHLDGPLHILVPDLVSIVIDPPATPGELDGDLERSEARLKHSLAEVGVESVAAARAGLEARRAVEREIKRLESEAATATPQADAQAALAAAKATLKGLEDQLDELNQGWRVLPLADEGVLTAQLDALVQQEAAAQKQHAAYKQELAQARQDFDTADAKATAGLSKLEGLRSHRDEAGWAEALAQATREIATATDVAFQAEQALTAHRQRHADTAPMLQLELAADRARSVLDNHDRLAKAKLERSTFLEGSLQGAGLEGLDEAISRTKDDLELAQRQLAREQARVDALWLLKTALQAAIKADQDRFGAPLTAAIQPYLQLVFPKADLSFGTTLAPQELIRSSGAQPPQREDHRLLSLGTKEQISVLARLAMADVLGAAGPTWPVILDDALGFSDDARLQAMFNALHLAARNRQVLVLTCHQKAFEALGGHQVTIEPVDR